MSDPVKPVLNAASPSRSASARRRGPTALGALVPDAVAPLLAQRGFANAAILTEWREIVGPHLAAWTSPVEIRWPRRAPEAAASPTKAPPRPKRNSDDKASRACLMVACPGAFALDIQMAEATIIEAVNRRLGFGCIGSIRVVQAPRPAPKAAPAPHAVDPALAASIEAGLGHIENAELRAALAALGAAIAGREGAQGQE